MRFPLYHTNIISWTKEPILILQNINGLRYIEELKKKNPQLLMIWKKKHSLSDVMFAPWHFDSTCRMRLSLFEYIGKNSLCSSWRIRWRYVFRVWTVEIYLYFFPSFFLQNIASQIARRFASVRCKKLLFHMKGVSR